MCASVYCRCSDVSTVHLSIYMSERLSHSVAGWSTRERDLTLSRVFITSSCFRFISPNCTFLEKSLYCDFLLLLWSPRSPTIAFPLALYFPPLPPSSAELGHSRSPPLLPRSSACLLTSLCPVSLLTLNTNRWPTAPAASLLSHDPLTSSCFSCWRRQLSKCLCEELLSFS